MAMKVTKKKEAVENVLSSNSAEAKKAAPKKKTATKKAPAAKKISVKKEKKAVVKTVSKKEKKVIAPNNAYVYIDYPLEAENISSSHYAIRIGASPDGYVELSFNDGEWNPCRYGGGYWWFDWLYFTPGNYKLSARMIGNDGSVVAETQKRKCKVC